MNQKKAVSPVVATVLLIMIVIVLALIIILWSMGFNKEIMMKKIGNEEKTVEKFCEEVRIEAIIKEDGFGFKNIGSVPVSKFKLKLTEKDTGSSVINEGGNVNPGFSAYPIKNSDDSNLIYDNYEEIKVVPILMAKKKSGAIEPFECSEEILI